MLQRLLKRYLAEAEIIPVTSLEEAVTLYQDHPFQAVIANAETVQCATDYIAERESLPPNVPLLLLAFWASSGNEQLLNVTDYLIKPITRPKLFNALHSLPQPLHTILIADDDPDIPQLFDRLLSLDPGQHYRLLQAANGYEALHLLRTRRPDLLLLDLTMPGLDGYEVLKEKESDPEIRDIPVFVISAHDVLEGPVTSAAILATCKSGIPVPDVLKSIAALSEILGLLSVPASLVQTEMQSD